MADKFLDVFSLLSESDMAKSLYNDTRVIKVTSNSNHDIIRVYLEFPMMIPKRRIHSLENEIKNSYFKEDNLDVVIIEKFLDRKSVV